LDNPNMGDKPMKRIVMALVLLAVPALAAACGGGNTGGGGGTGTSSGCPAPSGTNGSGTVKIGSKSDVPEDQLVAEMTKLVLEQHGFTVDNTFMATDKNVGTALQNGTVDLLWQYTG